MRSDGSISSLCLGSPIPGHSGPASFQRRLIAGLEQRSIYARFWPDCRSSQVVLIIGGTRRIPAVVKAKRSGAFVIQRLNGLNWIHRKQPTGLRHYLKAEWANLNLRLIRHRLADAVVYQSQFVEGWWNRVAGQAGVPARVIYNGVPLDCFKPGEAEPPSDRVRILLVEGNLAGGYEIGLEWAAELAARLRVELDREVELRVAGTVSAALRDRFEASQVGWLGVLSEDEIIEQHHRAHFLFASDLNAACPNSVLEAMACGTPVLAFETGALPELVDGQSGVLVDYRSDPWQVDRPDLEGLVEGAVKLLDGRSRFSHGARIRAQRNFGLDEMVDNYLAAFGEWTG